MGSSKKVTVGYRYRMGLHMGICHEPDALLEIRAGDRIAWQGHITETSQATISAPNLFGGDEREGGISGTMDVMMGRPDQGPNAYLASVQGGLQPSYRGFLGIVYRGLITSNNPYIKNWSVRVRSILRGWHGGAAWYPGAATIRYGGVASAALYFALDCSGSMTTQTPNGKTRLANMKAAVNAALDFIKEIGVDQGASIDVAIVAWGSSPASRSTITRRNVTAAGISDLKGFVGGMGAVYGTYFPAGLMDMAEFFAGSTAPAHTVFFITDGEPADASYTPTEIVQQAVALVAAQPGVEVHGVNIDLEDTSWTAQVDNTGGTVAVVEGGNPDALTSVIVGALSARFSMNPAHVILQCLTDPDWGMGYPIATIDQPSFRAAADRLAAEGLGVSFKWNNQATIGEFTQVVADHASLVFGQDRRTGLFRMRLLRHDYQVADLPVFTSKDVNVVRYQRPSLADTVNELVIQYTDGVTGKDASTAPLQNLANIQGQGRVVSQTLSFPGIPSQALAVRVGMRELQARSTPLWRFSIEARRRFARLLPGEPFVLDLRDTAIGVRLVMRPGEIDYGESADGVVRAECVEDVFSMPLTTYVEDPGPGGEVPDTEPKAGLFAAFEVPYTELVQGMPAADLAALPNDAGYVAAVATKPAGVPLNFDLHTRMAPAPFDYAATGDYAPGGVLAVPLGGDQEDRTIVLAASTQLAKLVIGGGAFLGEWPNSETVRIDAVDLVNLTLTVGRGCGDSIPTKWPAGTRLWGYDVEAVSDPQQYVRGEEVILAVVNKTATGQVDIATAPQAAVAIGSRQARPYPPANVLLNGVRRNPIVAGDLVFSWQHRDRVLQADTLVDATEPSIGPEPGTTYNVELWDQNRVMVLASSYGTTGTTTTIPISAVPAAVVLAEVSSERAGLRCHSVVSWLVEIPVAAVSLEFGSDPHTPPAGNNIVLQFKG